MSMPAVSPLRTPLGRTVLLLLAVAFAALLGANFMTARMIERTVDVNAAVEQSHEVRGAVRDLLAAALDAEAGQRGFLLTGHVAYLSIHDQAVARTPELLDRLQRQAAPNAAQQDRVRRLRALFRQRYALIGQGLDLYRSGDAGAAIDSVREGEGRRVTIEIRSLLSAIDAAESERLRRRSQRSAEAARQTVTVNAVGASLILLAAVIILILIRNYLAEIHEARRTLDEVNRGLEETVLERTEDLLKANDELALARDKAEALLREVNHRVGNSLQLVSSMILLQAKEAPGKAARDALFAAQARIEAVGQVHKKLYTSDQVGVVALDEYLRSLIDELRLTFSAGAAGRRIRLVADPVVASTDAAVPLGVIAAELVTNAVKYAYPTGEGGPIRVRLKADGPRRAVLSVEDDGVGLGEGGPKGTGLGAKILDAMAASLNSRVEYDRSHRGVRASIAFDR